jgi:hypothetical protein
MEKLLIALSVSLLVGCSSASTAQEVIVELEHVCEETNKLFETLGTVYGEEPIIMSPQPKSKNMFYSVWYNKQSQTSSVILTSISQNVSCILTMGESTVIGFKGKELF